MQSFQYSHYWTADSEVLGKPSDRQDHTGSYTASHKLGCQCCVKLHAYWHSLSAGTHPQHCPYAAYDRCTHCTSTCAYSVVLTTHRHLWPFTLTCHMHTAAYMYRYSCMVVHTSCTAAPTEQTVAPPCVGILSAATNDTPHVLTTFAAVRSCVVHHTGWIRAVTLHTWQLLNFDYNYRHTLSKYCSCCSQDTACIMQSWHQTSLTDPQTLTLHIFVTLHSYGNTSQQRVTSGHQLLTTATAATYYWHCKTCTTTDTCRYSIRWMSRESYSLLHRQQPHPLINDNYFPCQPQNNYYTEQPLLRLDYHTPLPQ